MNDRLVWIDCEMTGLDLRRDALIEVAVVVTDGELTPVDDGLDVIIHVEDDVLDTMVPFVQDMHAASGLTEAVRASTLTLGEAEKPVLDHIRASSPSRTPPRCAATPSPPTAASSPGTCPAVDEYLHYRMIDVSSIKELARRWFPRVYYAQPPKGLAHRALADIRESIEELAYYRETVFVAQPGPGSAEAEAAAKRVRGLPVE